MIESNFQALRWRKAERENRDIPLREIADETGLSLGTIHKLSSGSVKGVRIETLDALCAYFEVASIHDLIEYREENTVPLNAPKVFISHSSKDKARFVTDFAKRLRGAGIDAWLDQWEMLPGDSLVDKIFEEGLKDAQAFVVVLSNDSVKSKWVREELNNAFVRKIEGQTKVIPIVIDDVEIPESLRSTLYQKVPNVNSYDEEFKRIKNSIFGHSEKPPLGPAPAYLDTTLPIPHGLSDIDFFLLTEIFNWSLADDGGHFLVTQPLIEAAEQKGWATSNIIDAIVALCERGFLTPHYTLDRKNYPREVELSSVGWGFMFQQTRSDYDEVMRKLAAHLVNHADDYVDKDGRSLMKVLGESRLFTFHLLDELETHGYIKIRRTMGPSHYVSHVSPLLKRALESGGI